MNKVFGRDDQDTAETNVSSEAPAAAPSATPGADAVPVSATVAGTPAPISQVDVTAIMDAKEKAHPEDLDWKRSIVDLLKTMDIDSSYGARKEMALELGYTEEQIEKDGSAEMNMWLHKRVLQKFAANGGTLPDGLV